MACPEVVVVLLLIELHNPHHPPPTPYPFLRRVKLICSEEEQKLQFSLYLISIRALGSYKKKRLHRSVVGVGVGTLFTEHRMPRLQL